MEKEFINQLYKRHQNNERFPSSASICEFTSQVLTTLFPGFSENKYTSLEMAEAGYADIGHSLSALLTQIKGIEGAAPIVKNFMSELPEIYSRLNTDITAIVRGDPAARSEFEVVRTYPGFYAIAMYRIAHELYKQNIPVMPRIITEFAHSRTGIDIHPGATIGPHFCIDHGTGIVIGETTVIGQYVKLYQGVTLGALSVDKNMAEKKRHPTIGDYVVVYSGATILGGNTTIGDHSIIGGNVWLTKGVPAYSTVYHKAQIEVSKVDHRSDIPNS